MQPNPLIEPGVQALHRLVNQCIEHQGHSTRPIASFIVNLYNPAYAKVDVSLLCQRIDVEHFVDVIAVMKMFRVHPRRSYLHTIIPDGERSIHLIMDLFGHKPRKDRL